ncbi:tyrosine-protein phosphatase [Actinocorallia longicatena]|uniref:Tyrosine specific protein phosphatases domain-containing protein n=1 Tax=Actinocorallia longicatena TaxID=111803 RepID=A0ABP6PUS5_9ACTN
MSEHNRWISLEGAVNVRDLGGLPTHDGAVTRPGHLYRSDNLQGLTPADVALLTGAKGLGHVIDLRSNAEVRLEGPGPLVGHPGVVHHHLSLFAEAGRMTDVDADPEAAADVDKVLPWQRRPADGGRTHRSVGFYHAYLRDRPDSIIDALRVIAHEDRASIVHCAAGKDRTGVVVALALGIAGVTRPAIVADYAATGERISAILARLKASPTYSADLDKRPDDSHIPHASIMEKFLAGLDEEHGGPARWLTAQGWTDDDTAALRSRLL